MISFNQRTQIIVSFFALQILGFTPSSSALFENIDRINIKSANVRELPDSSNRHETVPYEQDGTGGNTDFIATPSGNPSSIPSSVPTSSPTSTPSETPSSIPSSVPSSVPSSIPSSLPSSIPSSI